jgi:tetratricopeptide (TPR) repeat protein
MNRTEIFLKGYFAFKDGLIEDSLIYFQSVLEIDPDNSESWYNVALSLVELGDYDRAIHHLDKALEIDPYDEFIADARFNAKQLKYEHQYNIKI